MLRLRPANADHWRHVGALVSRIPTFMRRFQLESDPAVVIAHLTSFWAAGSETVGLWVLLDGERVVGHLIAMIESLWGVPYGMVMQAEIDHPYVLSRNQQQDMLAQLRAWATAQGATDLKILTSRNPDAWIRAMGFEADGTLLRMPC